MKLNLSALCILSALALSLNACGGDDNNEENKTCTQSVCKDNSVLIQCNNGVEAEVPCANGCEAGACKAAPVVNCTYTDPKCSADSMSVLTCSNGIESSTPCDNGCINGACVSGCTFEGVKCKADGSAVISCNNGQEKVESVCEKGCENATCKVPCTADKCSDDQASLIKCSDGVETTETCVNGCENNACRPKCEYTENICNTDNTAALSCNNGKETSTKCEKGCKDGACMDCTEATEAVDCGAGRICVNGACEAGCTADKCEGDNLLACKNGRYEAVSASNKCEVKCVDDAMGDGKSICVDADYCKVAEDCANREDGKTICVTSKHVCESLACRNVECKTDETCVLGACVRNSDLTVDKGAECDPKTFVDHCRGDKIAMCALKDKSIPDKKCDEAGNVCTYGVTFSDCTKSGFNGCASYKDGLVVKTSCVEARSADEICGSTDSGSECVDRSGWSEVTTYTCTLTTENNRVALMSGYKLCEDGDYCNNAGTDCE